MLAGARGELRNNLEERVAFAKDLGLKQMILATFGLRSGSTLGDWDRACDDLNKIGEVRYAETD